MSVEYQRHCCELTLVVHAENYVTVRFVRRHSAALAKLERELPFQRFAALICVFSLCSVVTELPAWTTSGQIGEAI